MKIKNPKQLLFVFLFVMLSTFGSLLASTYTVGPGADYLTFDSLFSSVDLEPGDVVEAQAASSGGSYTFIGSGAAVIELGSDDAGATGNHLIIRARPGDTIILDGEHSRYGVQLKSSNDFITIDGFNMEKYNSGGVYLVGKSKDERVSNVIVKNCKMTSNSIGNDQFGFKVYRTDNITLLNNSIHIIAADNPGQTDGFIFGVSQDIIVDGNFFFDENTHDEPPGNDQGHNDGLQVIGGLGTIYNPFDYVKNYTVRNNVFMRVSDSVEAKQLLYFEYEVKGRNIIYNNVFYNQGPSNSNLVSIFNKNYQTSGTFEFYNNTFRVMEGLAFRTELV